ncbi:hypothetical protein [Aneurinibacillus terranovensis]|uniref:hypothetical protein n=1 Tax=Aneurinibacillus terranovensis TaxID=278991 RepID=UPI0004212720|nr:hypothetical protein [Aneurinibacillus terranovensis]
MNFRKYLALSLTLAGLIANSLSVYAAEPTTSEEAKMVAGEATPAEFQKINDQLTKLDQQYYLKDHENVKRPANVLKSLSENKLDLRTAPDSIAKISGVRVDTEYNPILMYASDPNSWGRHLLGDKDTSGGTLYLTTYGYVSTFTDNGSTGCAVPYYWSDVKKGDPVRIRNLENQTYAISAGRTDFGPNQKYYGDRIVDLGSYWNTQLHGNGMNYVRTYIQILGGNHY